MTMKSAVICTAAVVALSATGLVAAPQSTAVRDSIKGAFDMAQGYVTRAAEQVPEDKYSFKATPDVRSLGQLFAHVADVNFVICGAVAKENSPLAGTIEKTATTKAAIQKALADSVAFCNKAFETVNDASGAEALKLFGALDSTRLGALAFNNAHVMEHYGNIVTYMRLNQLVPPSSQR
jgi:uncharacterized damage-inducible protein DinB